MSFDTTEVDRQVPEVDRGIVPDASTALLTVKIGDVSRTSRKHLTVTTFGFLVSEGLDVFRAKVDSCTNKALENVHGHPYVREDMGLYMRPGAHSKQAELVQITFSNFESRVARSYKNYLKRKTEDSFRCEVYVYVKKIEPLRRRRMKDILESKNASDLLRDFTQSQGMSSNGEPSGTLKRKHSIGSEEDERCHSLQDVAFYHTVRMIVNGVIVPVQVNVQDLLACFGSFQQQTLGPGTSVEAHESDDIGAEGSNFHE
ncbi:uncharacterized protein PHALS_00901 [Plasmopara halstedii]|uniref:Uncharacterized protein n=1 Tax=Plasmopara halstedii TaxID=4781 RepID=A0A0P1AVL2_PLAHL|nr:uncharacterized protein PHALS_00901 [Plasmopara halstedii]CEG44545.1 hypothetical protein PHALS_00901 [Plasmopara halstedii]|eukprot:XP_024580914.1 hypothetical protein PHALS_00901 [Plasmopara halstedii]